MGSPAGLGETVRLLPTPTAEDARASGGAASREDGRQAMLHDTARRLLPTPQAADGDGGRQEKGAMGRGGVRPSGHKATLPLPTAVAMRDELTETPFSAPADDDGQLALLPTPVAAMGGPGAGGELRAAIVHGEGRRSLPTPTSRDGKGRNQRDDDSCLPGAVALAEGRVGRVEWGVYEAAVRRWEDVLVRDAPAPTDEKGRLDPPFVEWMLGYPEGWFDVDGVSRTRKLRALGNSVQVQCGEAVGGWLRFLLDSGLLEAAP